MRYIGEAVLKMHLEGGGVLWTELPIPSPSMFAIDTCVAKNCWQDYLLVILPFPLELFS